MDTPTGDYFLKKANDFSSELDDIEISATLGYSSDKTAPYSFHYFVSVIKSPSSKCT